MTALHQRDRLRALLYQMTEHEVQAFFEQVPLRMKDKIEIIVEYAHHRQISSWLDAEECEKTGVTP